MKIKKVCLFWLFWMMTFQVTFCFQAYGQTGQNLGCKSRTTAEYFKEAHVVFMAHMRLDERVKDIQGIVLRIKNPNDVLKGEGSTRERKLFLVEAVPGEFQKDREYLFFAKLSKRLFSPVLFVIPGCSGSVDLSTFEGKKRFEEVKQIVNLTKKDQIGLAGKK